jgi:hypothetical protein
MLLDRVGCELLRRLHTNGLLVAAGVAKPGSILDCG